MKYKMFVWMITFFFLISFVSAAIDDTELTAYFTYYDSPADSVGVSDGTNGGATQSNSSPAINTGYYIYSGAQWIDYGSEGSLVLSGDMSMCAWLKTAPPASLEFAFGKYSTTAGTNGWGVFTNTGGVVFFALSSDCSAHSDLTSTGALSNDGWTFVCTTFNTNGSQNIYINGLMDITKDSGYNSVCNPSINASTGRPRPSGTQYFNGRIDEFSVWNKTLTDAEILELNNSFYPFGGAPAGDTLNITAQAPTNNTQYLNVNMRFNVTVQTNNTFDCDLYINDTLNASNNTNTAGDAVIVNFDVTVGDGDYNWYIECDDEQNPENSSTYVFYIDTVTPIITWTTPSSSNNSAFANNMVSLITLTDNNLYSYYYNITYLNGTIYDNQNYTNTSLTGMTEANITHPISFTGMNGLFKAVVKACDGHTNNLISIDPGKTADKLLFDNIKIYPETSVGMTDLGYTYHPEKFSFYFDTVSQTTTKTFIVEGEDYVDVLDGKTVYPGHLVVDGLYWVDFSIPGLKSTKVVRLSDSKVSVTVTLTKATKEWSFESIGELNCQESHSLFYVYEMTEDYDNLNVLEGQTTTYYLNISYNSSYMNDVFANFTFNNTVYNPTKTVYSDAVGFTYTKTMPGIYGLNETNITFYWNYTVDDGSSNTTTNATLHNNSLFKIRLGSCSTYETNTLNLTIYYQSNSTAANGSYEVTVYNYSKYGYEYNYSTQQDGVMSVNLCLYPSFSDFQANIQTEYTKSGFDTFTYWNYNINLTSSSQNVSLYLVNDTTQITFTVTDENDNVVEDVYIHVLKYDVGTGAYTLTGILKTDYFGIALGQLTLNDWYKFILYYDGDVVLSTSPTIMTSTTKTFRINLLGDYFANYDVVQGISSTLTFNNDTKNFRFTYSDSSGTIHYGCLKVIKRTINGDTLINDTCTLSSAATILVNIGSDVGENLYLATGYIRFDEPFVLQTLSVGFNNQWMAYGSSGVFVSMLLIGSLATVGLWSPAVALILVGVGFIFTNILGFFHLGWEYLITVIILLVIAVYRMRDK